MQISVNGQERQAHPGTTVAALLEELRIAGPVAVELNRKVCPKQSHQTTELGEGDVLEIVTIVGGG